MQQRLIDNTLSSSSSKFALTNLTKAKEPLIFDFHLAKKIKDYVLGKQFDLSVVLLEKNKIHYLNKKYRKKDKPTNVLAFKLSKNFGEIFLCPSQIKKETYVFGRKPKALITDMFIHALCHLKGMRHGSKMESVEKKIRQKFGLV